MQQPPDEGQPRPPQPPYYPPPGQQYGPPQGQYPQQQPYYPPPQQPPPKKRRRVWLWIVLGVLAVVVLGCIGTIALISQTAKNTTNTGALATTSSSTNVPTSKASTPVGQQKWTTVRTFSGSSSKKTPFFTVPENWRLNWTCKGGEFGGNLSVTVYGPGNAYVDLPVNATCSAGKTVSDTTEEHQGGSIYLDVSALSDWTIQVQELK